MQVSHHKNHVTHAVIGGMQTIEMGVSDGAALMHLLSSTLYKDQKLAMIREVLCNAWDAHIEAGIKHVPVEITLTPEKFIIRDFGSGIHHDDIGPIYGVYGNSTKKNDGKQTGGFGLGSKAPFAYTDHFEVISCHAGVKTIYNMSRSSAQVLGKPGIVPIASFPTDETGIQVTVELVSAGDFHRFKQLIKRIASNGDMNVMYNGEKISTLGFGTNKGNYLITDDTDIADNMSPLMVRYGNVIYPIDRSDEIKFEYDRIKAHLDNLRGGTAFAEYRIIFQAAPHTISVQPSRENLSFQEHTLTTLKELLNGFMSTLKEEFLVECNKVAQEVIDEAVSEVRYVELLNSEEKLPATKKSIARPGRIDDLTEMAHRYMRANYPKTLRFRKKDLAYRVKAMIDGGLIQRGLGQTFIGALKRVHTRFAHSRERTDWLHKQIVGPVLTKMQDSPLDRKRLYLFDAELQNAPRDQKRAPLVLAEQAQPKHLFACMPYLRNIVVLSTAKADLWERCKQHPVFKEMGRVSGCLFYYVGMKKTDKEQALAFFKSTGMEIVDLTFRQEWEEAAQPTSQAVAAPRKPAKVGLPCLSGIMVPGDTVDTRWLLEDSVKRIVNPEFIVNVSLRADQRKDCIGYFKPEVSNMIIKLFGDKGAITNNSAVHAKAISKGAQPFNEYLLDKVGQFMMTNANVQEYWAYHPKRAMLAAHFSYYDPDKLVGAIYNSETLRNQLGLKNNLTKEERMYVRIWNAMVKWYGDHSRPDAMKKVMAHLNIIPVHQTNLDLLYKVKTSKLAKLIDEKELDSILTSYNHTSHEAKTVIEVLGLIFK